MSMNVDKKKLSWHFKIFKGQKIKLDIRFFMFFVWEKKKFNNCQRLDPVFLGNRIRISFFFWGQIRVYSNRIRNSAYYYTAFLLNIELYIKKKLWISHIPPHIKQPNLYSIMGLSVHYYIPELCRYYRFQKKIFPKGGVVKPDGRSRGYVSHSGGGETITIL